MIPTIETIVEDLLAGTITKQQAIAWLNQHAEDSGYCLRDEFAGRAMQGELASQGMDFSIKPNRFTDFAQRCYQIADAMLAERAK